MLVCYAMLCYLNIVVCGVCLWFCRVSWRVGWFLENGQVGVGVNSLIYREGKGYFLFFLSLLLFRVSRFGGYQFSGVQFCGWYRDVVGRWGGVWVFFGWRLDRSFDIKEFRGEDDDIVQSFWGVGGIRGNVGLGLGYSFLLFFVLEVFLEGQFFLLQGGEKWYVIGFQDRKCCEGW